MTVCSAFRNGYVRLEGPFLLLASFVPLNRVRDVREGQLLLVFLSLWSHNLRYFKVVCRALCLLTDLFIFVPPSHVDRVRLRVTAPSS